MLSRLLHTRKKPAWGGRKPSTCCLPQALLGGDHGADRDGASLRALVGSVLNVNFPAGDRLRGLYLAHQARAIAVICCK